LRNIGISFEPQRPTMVRRASALPQNLQKAFLPNWFSNGVNPWSARWVDSLRTTSSGAGPPTRPGITFHYRPNVFKQLGFAADEVDVFHNWPWRRSW